MRKIVAALAGLLAVLCVSVMPALAQGNTTGKVITTCGTVSPLFKAGNPGPFTLDINGQLCINGTFTTASPKNITPITCSAAIIAGGSAQNFITGSANLTGAFIQDIDTSFSTGIWVSWLGAAAPNALDSFYIPPYNQPGGAGSWTAPPGFGFNSNLSVYAQDTGHKISCVKY